MKTLTTAVAFVLAALALTVAAAAAGGKATWLVKLPHTAEECLAALDAHSEHDQKLLSRIDWGCAGGDHTGYVKIDAAGAEDAVGQLPPRERKTAQATKLVKFTPEQIRAFHKKE